ncbi:hypothetical protein GQ457_12G030770 [Hibiscus cannabinus]
MEIELAVEDNQGPETTTITLPEGHLAGKAKPEREREEKLTAYYSQCTTGLKERRNSSTETLFQDQETPKLNFSAMKLFTRFCNILMRLIFPGTLSLATTKQNKCGRFDPPKTSCSSYYSRYCEAIADCIVFFNKSAQDEILDGLKSDVLV